MKSGPMDLELLQTFLEVGKTRHFGKAADNLFLTQSAVSARIRSLEAYLNAQLFERTTKQVVLSAEGERLIKHAESMLLAWDNAKLDMANKVDADSLLALGSTPGLWHYAFNHGLAVLFSSSDVFINSRSYSAEDLTQLLCNNALDAAMLYEKINEPNIDSMVMGNLNLRLFTSQPVTHKSELKSLKYIHVDWGNSFNLFIDKHFKKSLNLCLKTDNAQSAQHVLMDQGGAAYLPELILDHETQLHCVEKVIAPIYKRKVYGCFSNQSVKKSAIKNTLENLKM
jgi:DNA-binding transcriptional LysR family regulator